MAANRSWAVAPASSLATAVVDMVAGEERGIGYCKRPISANGVLDAAISARRLFVVNILKSRRLVASKEEKRAHDNSRAEEIDSPAATHPSSPEPEVLVASRVSSLPHPPPPNANEDVCVCVQRCNLRGRWSRLKGSGQGPELPIHHSGLFPETHLIHRQSHCDSRGKKLISWDPQSGLFLRWTFLDAFFNPSSTTLCSALSGLDSGLRSVCATWSVSALNRAADLFFEI